MLVKLKNDIVRGLFVGITTYLSLRSDMPLATFRFLKIVVARVLIDPLFWDVVLTFMDDMSHLSNLCSYLIGFKNTILIYKNWKVSTVSAEGRISGPGFRGGVMDTNPSYINDIPHWPMTPNTKRWKGVHRISD